MSKKAYKRVNPLKLPQNLAAEENMNRWIGRFEERIDNLIEAFGKERQDQSTHRANVLDVMQSFSLSVQALTKEVSDMKPLVSDYRERRDQAIGAQRFARVMWLGAVSLASVFGAAIAESIRYLRS